MYQWTPELEPCRSAPFSELLMGWAVGILVANAQQTIPNFQDGGNVQCIFEW